MKTMLIILSLIFLTTNDAKAKTVYINQGKLLENTALAKQLFREKIAPIDMQLSKFKRRYKKAAMKLSGSTLSISVKKEIEATIAEYTEKTRKLQRDRQIEMKIIRKTTSDRIKLVLEKVLNRYVANNNVSAIQKAESMLYFDPSLDVSDEIVKMVDRELKVSGMDKSVWYQYEKR